MLKFQIGIDIVCLILFLVCAIAMKSVGYFVASLWVIIALISHWKLYNDYGER